jgi:ABC-type glycerol-3-phosphate transport system substrate-binding protein
MKKILILIAVGCFFVSGCDRAPAADKAAKKPEIVMWLVGSESQAITIRSLAKGFYEKTGIDVKCEAISWGEAHSKYLTSIAGGVAPDIGTMGLTWGTEFGALGAMVDLASAYPEEVAAVKQDVFPGLWRSIEYKGRVFGIPFDITEYVLYYRTDIVKDTPDTWEALVKTLTGLNAAGKGMIFDWGSLSWLGYSPFLWQAGGDYYSRDYSRVTIDSPEALVALKFFSELYTKHNVPKTKIPLEQGMRTGDFPLAISGNWMVDSLRLLAPEIEGRWSIATMPKGPSGRKTAFIGGRVMGIFDQSKHKKESWEFIKYLSTPDVQKALYEAALTKEDTYLPPGKRTWGMLNMDPKFKKVLMDQAEDSNGPPAISDWDSCTRYIDSVIQEVVLQEADPKIGLKKVQQELEWAATKR